jgi:hypothetical protein
VALHRIVHGPSERARSRSCAVFAISSSGTRRTRASRLSSASVGLGCSRSHRSSSMRARMAPKSSAARGRVISALFLHYRSTRSPSYGAVFSRPSLTASRPLHGPKPRLFCEIGFAYPRSGSHSARSRHTAPRLRIRLMLMPSSIVKVLGGCEHVCCPHLYGGPIQDSRPSHRNPKRCAEAEHGLPGCSETEPAIALSRPAGDSISPCA